MEEGLFLQINCPFYKPMKARSVRIILLFYGINLASETLVAIKKMLAHLT